MVNVIEHIRNRIAGMPAGEPFLSARFLDLGSRPAVDQALSRLVKAGTIARVMRGVFVRPKKSQFVTQVLPSPFEIARALATSTGVVVDIQGAEAVRYFKLSTQVPIKSVFFTSGPSRHLKLGHTELVLRHVALRKLALAGRPAGLALAALWYLGKKGVTVEILAKVLNTLDPAEREAFRGARSMMPAWMTSTLLQYEGSQNVEAVSPARSDGAS
jgi:hypothetical protein